MGQSFLTTSIVVILNIPLERNTSSRPFPSGAQIFSQSWECLVSLLLGDEYEPPPMGGSHQPNLAAVATHPSCPCSGCSAHTGVVKTKRRMYRCHRCSCAPSCGTRLKCPGCYARVLYLAISRLLLSLFKFLVFCFS